MALLVFTWHSYVNLSLLSPPSDLNYIKPKFISSSFHKSKQHQWALEVSTMLLQWLGMLFHINCVFLSCHLLNSDTC